MGRGSNVLVVLICFLVACVVVGGRENHDGGVDVSFEDDEGHPINPATLERLDNDPVQLFILFGHPKADPVVRGPYSQSELQHTQHPRVHPMFAHMSKREILESAGLSSFLEVESRSRQYGHPFLHPQHRFKLASSHTRGSTFTDDPFDPRHWWRPPHQPAQRPAPPAPPRNGISEKLFPDPPGSVLGTLEKATQDIRTSVQPATPPQHRVWRRGHLGRSFMESAELSESGAKDVVNSVVQSPAEFCPEVMEVHMYYPFHSTTSPSSYGTGIPYQEGPGFSESASVGGNPALAPFNTYPRTRAAAPLPPLPPPVLSPAMIEIDETIGEKNDDDDDETEWVPAAPAWRDWITNHMSEKEHSVSGPSLHHLAPVFLQQERWPVLLQTGSVSASGTEEQTLSEEEAREDAEAAATYGDCPPTRPQLHLHLFDPSQALQGFGVGSMTMGMLPFFGNRLT